MSSAANQLIALMLTNVSSTFVTLMQPVPILLVHILVNAMMDSMVTVTPVSTAMNVVWTLPVTRKVSASIAMVDSSAIAETDILATDLSAERLMTLQSLVLSVAIGHVLLDTLVMNLNAMTSMSAMQD